MCLRIRSKTIEERRLDRNSILVRAIITKLYRKQRLKFKKNTLELIGYREMILKICFAGAIVALGVFGAFVFLAAVVTTVVLLIRR